MKGGFPSLIGQRSRWTGLWIGLGLLLWGGVYLRGLAGAVDLSAADEGLYIQRATLWVTRHWPVAREWGPLYHAWYGLLLRRTDPPTAFYLNLYLTSWLPAALFGGLVFRFTRQVTWSLLAGTLYLISWGNAGDWRVNHFLLLLLLAGLALLPVRISSEGRLPWLVFQAWWAWGLSFVRPEMALTALLLGLWAGWEALRGWPRYRTHRAWQGALALGILLLGVGGYGSALGAPSGRMLAAFGQHFAVRWVARTGLALNPYHQWPQVLQSQFGPVHSLGQAVRRRPDLVWWFVTRNLRGWFLVFAQRLAPYPWRSYWPVWTGGLLAVGAWALASGWKHRGLAATLRAPSPWVGALLLWALPSLVSSWLFYPRPHYQAVPLALFFGAWAWVLARRWPLPWRSDLVLGALLLGVLVGWGPQPYRLGGERPRLATVCTLRQGLASYPRAQAVLTDSPHMAFLYLADRLAVQTLAPETWRHPPEEWPHLWYPWPLSDEAQAQLPWLAALARAPQRWGYTPVTLPDGSRWLSRIPLPEVRPGRTPWRRSICAP